MNYRHGYHAGSLADLIKHLTLAHLLVRFRAKDAGFCVLDTHAGAGSYDLRSVEANKTGEAKAGVVPFASMPPHPALEPLQSVLQKWNHGIQLGADFKEAQLGFYPGSPAVVKHYLRPQDRLVVVEKHPEEMAKLRKLLHHEKNVMLHERDGFEAPSALLPVPEKRVLVFIDPPFEKPDEMEKSLEMIIKGHARVSHAIFALWYPLVDDVAVARMKEQFAASALEKILCVEAEYQPSRTMKGCGMILVNAPYQIETVLSEALGLLKPLFEKNAPEPIVEWIKAA